MSYHRCYTSDTRWHISDAILQMSYVFSHKVGPQIVQQIVRFYMLDAQPLYQWSGIASRQWGWTGEVAPFLGPAPKVMVAMMMVMVMVMVMVVAVTINIFSSSQKWPHHSCSVMVSNRPCRRTWCSWAMSLLALAKEQEMANSSLWLLPWLISLNTVQRC